MGKRLGTVKTEHRQMLWSEEFMLALKHSRSDDTVIACKTKIGNPARSCLIIVLRM